MQKILYLALPAAMTLLWPVMSATAQDSDAAMVSFDGCLQFSRPACDDVLRTDPTNLTALFMRGLTAELAADDVAALADFETVVAREPRHFGAQLWRHVAGTALGQTDSKPFRDYLDQSALPDWPRGLGLLYLGAMPTGVLLDLANAQPPAARAEALCAAHYHIGRAAALAGDRAGAEAHFQAALATGATRVFEYRAARQALEGTP